MERFHSSLDNREGLRDELHKLNRLIDAHRSKMRSAQDKMDDLAVQNWKDEKKTAKFEEENAVLKKKIKSFEEEVFEIEKKARHEGILTRAKTMNDLYQKACSAGYEKGQQDDQA
ncbi:hypothetical protein WN944_010952 [Citrus x changshan-huyou]|uniref:Uncharacterized protein n=1 Tax=Citrus x changshan-huyou TaxID=2935761 RepID=A0AAP0MV31_9ROSI